MKCPSCNHSDTKVTDTRVSGDNTSIRRRRKCLECEYKFSTMEVYCKSELIVIKQSGREEDFDSEKIASGIRKAMKNDEMTEKKISEIMANIEQWLSGNHIAKIHTTDIGQIVMQELKSIDPIAYLRFASIYKNFHETEEFEKEFQNLKN